MLRLPRFSIAVTIFLGYLTSGAPAQSTAQGQPEANSEVTEVTVYQAVVIGDGTIEGADKVSTIGPEPHQDGSRGG